MPWDPDQYHRFQAERFAPFDDLARMLRVHGSLRVVDLGCGTGELTRRLADLLPDSDVVGIDTSIEMLTRADAQARPGLRFEFGDLAVLAGTWDVVFSHAAIQWVDDHERLIPHLWSLVAPGGQLLIQQPSNHNHVSHVIVRELAVVEPFRSRLQGYVRIPPVLPVERYAEILFEQGAGSMTVFEKVYPHIMENADGVVEWTSGTLLVPYFERLGDMKDAFLNAYRQRLREKMPGSPVFYGFRRILFSATKPT